MSEPDIAALTHSDSEAPPSERSRAVDWNKPRVAAILAAAARCFARSGFETTTAEIAKELGVPKSIIYHYFDNKTALIQEVQRYAYHQHLQKVKEALTAAGLATGRRAIDGLRALWQTKSTRNIEFDVGVWSALRSDDVLRQQALDLHREHRRLVAESVARALGIEGDDPARTEPLTTLIVAALNGLALNAYVAGSDEEAEQAHEVLLQLVERGIEQFTRRDSEIPPSRDLLSEPPPTYNPGELRPPYVA